MFIIRCIDRHKSNKDNTLQTSSNMIKMKTIAIKNNLNAFNNETSSRLLKIMEEKNIIFRWKYFDGYLKLLIEFIPDHNQDDDDDKGEEFDDKQNVHSLFISLHVFNE